MMSTAYVGYSFETSRRIGQRAGNGMTATAKSRDIITRPRTTATAAKRSSAYTHALLLAFPHGLHAGHVAPCSGTSARQPSPCSMRWRKASAAPVSPCTT